MKSARLLCLLMSVVRAVEMVFTGPQIAAVTRKLLTDYDRTLIPTDVDRKPLLVRISIYIVRLEPSRGFDMSYSFSMYLRIFWNDYRLKSWKFQQQNFNKTEKENILLPNEFAGKIWTPDIYFNQGKSVSIADITEPNRSFRISPDGRVFYSQRILVTKASCHMDLKRFPFDEQLCRFELESFGYDTQHLKLDWFNETSSGAPVLQEQTLNALNEYKLNAINWGRGDDNNKLPLYASRSRLYMTFHFERLTSYYIWQMYIPCILIVMLSWVNFWIDYRSTPARVGLGITTVLTMASLGNSLRSSLPRVSYSKSIDWYLLVCFFYVFCALVEFAIVGITDLKWKSLFTKDKKDRESYHRREKMKSAPTNNSRRVNIVESPATSAHLDTSALHALREKYNSNLRQKKSTWGAIREKVVVGAERRMIRSKQVMLYVETHVIDEYSRCVFPISFLIFNVIYFVVYLV